MAVLPTNQTPIIEEGGAKNPNYDCYWYGCKNISPFVCRGSVLCKEMGCGRKFCHEHRADLSPLFFQKHNFEPDESKWESEAICNDHGEDANRRINCAFGFPALFFIILSIICLALSILGIVSAMDDVEWELPEKVVN